MNELVPFVRLKNIDPTGPGYVKAMLSSRVCHLYVVFGQYGVEKPSVGLLVNYHEPLRFPGCRDNHGCEIGYNTGSERDPTNDIDFAPFGGDLTKLRGAKVAFQFPFTDAYKGPNSLRVGDLFNILRGSYDSLPIEHHTNLTRFKLVTDGSENLWNQRGVRDLITQWMVRLYECGFIRWEAIGQAIDIQLIGFASVRTNNFHDIVGHIFTDAGPPDTLANIQKCNVSARPIARGRFLEESVLRVEKVGDIILPYEQSQ